MFGIGFPELVFIFLLALMLFGPEKLPEIARGIGKLTGELKKGSDAMRREFYNSVYTPTTDWKGRIEQEARNLVTLTPEEQEKQKRSHLADTCEGTTTKDKEEVKEKKEESEAKS